MNLMEEFEEFQEEILVANGSTMLSRGKGLVKLNINGKQLTLEHCLFIPEVSQLNDKNYRVFFSKNSCSIKRNEDVFSLTGENGIFIFNTTPVVMMTLNPEVHQRFGHPGRDASLKMGIKPVPICKGCAEGEHASKPFRKEKVAEVPTRNPLESIHMDICGPLPMSSLNGERYIFDDFSRFSEVYFLVKKSDAITKFVEFKNKYEKLLKSKILEVKTDNGGEFCSLNLVNFLKEKEFKRKQLLLTHTNKMAKRKD